MRISGLSLIPVGIALAAVMFALSACGGGGAGNPGNGGSDTSQALRSVAHAIALSWIPPVEDLIIIAADNPTPGCPTISPQDNGVVLDFGQGCSNNTLGTTAGSVYVTETVDGYRLEFRNFIVEYAAASMILNGQLTVDTSSLSASGQLTYGSGSCRVQCNVTEVTLTESTYTIRGTVTTSRGSFPYVANVSYDGDCDGWPTGGNIVISNGAARIDYLPTCGRAQFTINGQPAEVNRDILKDTSPCN